MARLQASLRDYANEKGYDVNYDPKTGMVTVGNKASNRSISFKSGQGQEYGMAGAYDGYNMISDTAKLDDALSVPKPQKSTAGMYDYFNGATDKYTSEWDDDISSLYKQIKDMPSFDYSTYDPNKDAGFVAFRDNAIKQGNTAYDNGLASMARPGIADSSIGRQVAESARSHYMDAIQNAIPTFMNQARNDYNQGLQDKYNLLNTTIGLKENEYNLFSKERSYGDSKEALYEQETGYRPVDTANVPMDDPLRQYSDNYMAEINKRKAANPNDPTIPILESLRYEKMVNNPEVVNKYGLTVTPPMGWKTPATVAGENQAAFENSIAERKMALDEQEFALKQAKASGSGSGSTKISDADYGLILQGLYEAPDAVQWTIDNQAWLLPALGQKQYDNLLADAKKIGFSSENAFNQATPEQKQAYNYLREIYIGGTHPITGANTPYLDDPAAALKQMEYEGKANRRMLGGLYDVLYKELESKIAEGKKTKVNEPTETLDSIKKEMATANDPLAVYNARVGELSKAQIDELTQFLRSLQLAKKPASNTKTNEYSW